jgi:hypothetical protein
VVIAGLLTMSTTVTLLLLYLSLGVSAHMVGLARLQA